MAAPSNQREGNLEAPTRHPIDWKSPEYYDEEKLMAELERVFDLCHGCRRCVSLCQSFPTLFDLVDESDTMEIDGVDKQDYWQVVDHCYLCDLCYMTKCPYVPPHEWNIDFPHLMLRGKAVKYKKGDVKLRDRVLTSTDNLGKLAGIPVVAGVVNRFNKANNFREILDHALGVHPQAKLPEFHGKPLRKRLAERINSSAQGTPAGATKGKVALFSTCYGNYNEPHVGEDLVAVFEHNGIPVTIAPKEQCCGMPKLELGNLEAVEAAKEANIPVLAELVDAGWDIVAPVPSCALMFKQELPLLFPDDPAVKKVADAIFDIFEYLVIRHKNDLLKTDFKQGLGKVAYHAACHQRVQNVGAKTKELLSLIPDTQVTAIERCSGHDGTYAVKSEFHAHAMKIGKPVVNRVKQAEADHYGSDCPMAGHHIENGLDDGRAPEHPISLLRIAYGV
ncbi:MAG: Fe-S oxidoreductase [Candidatus Thiodiazotropha sp. (ex Ctena orbiculata)]|nr:Fe-S oxidoreductase [Candidatus Thiodiazotropha taylori]PUB88409.1 MAG: Fe-S oxidoreductase [gamma proteobacterium symbiont of Ctena orbiculata]MBT2995398.1 Fe-S oxidoreductase [Candidatus Thiodiazotropha taylori]MBT3001858.1 Fe-S oxidoreductase [Candidatus Thiodiazotropha taylori]MBT3028566.1 Fe-S oxidoreductase [Candidatus Thiodiazotropha taylori]